MRCVWLQYEVDVKLSEHWKQGTFDGGKERYVHNEHLEY